MAVSGARLLFIAVASCLFLAGPYATAAITCGAVYGAVTPCLRYALGRDLQPSTACCNGLGRLNSAATTKADRQAACSCLTRLKGTYTGVDYGRISGLPGRCNIVSPVPIDPSIDCSTIS
ncbi:non-specific lipid-transfer protein 2B-like [Wolffia australiana]